MQAFISAKNNQEIIVLPFLTEEPDVECPQKNEDFGDLKLIGRMGLRQVPLKVLLPKTPIRGMAKGSIANPQHYIDWLNRLRAERIPFRLVLIKNDGTEFLNMPVLINGYVVTPLHSGHVMMEMELEEFRFKNIKGV